MEIYIPPYITSNYEVITLSEKSQEETDCIACSTCNSCLAGMAAVMLKSKKYCWQCFEKVFGKTCVLCQKLITGVSQMNFIYYNNQVWHKDCFKCSSCGKPLSNRAFVQFKSNVYCTQCRMY